MPRPTEFVLTLSCRDTKGIVHAVSGLLFQAGCNIIDSQQYGDVLSSDATGLFFLRVHFEAPPHLADVATLQPLFRHLSEQFGMDARLHSLARKPRVMLMVSKHGHCLNDLLFRWRSGQLEVEIPAIVSNHPDYADLAASYGIPFHHLPLPTGAPAEAKRAQEKQVEALAAKGLRVLCIARRQVDATVRDVTLRECRWAAVSASPALDRTRFIAF